MRASRHQLAPLVSLSFWVAHKAIVRLAFLLHILYLRMYALVYALAMFFVLGMRSGNRVFRTRSRNTLQISLRRKGEERGSLRRASFTLVTLFDLWLELVRVVVAVVVKSFIFC